MICVREIEGEADLEFVFDMMYEAIYIPEDKPPKEELLNSPPLRKYSENWGRRGDCALLALDESNHPVGAAWYRLFTEEEQGYGFVDEATPELGIALTEEARNQGIGAILMNRLMEVASQDGYKGLSLSVDSENGQALKLYQKLGFQVLDSSSSSWTMKCTFTSL